MHRSFAMVSVNGGWNLLIGAQTRGGGWEAVDVPPECATVWDEAGKDACFERAGRQRVASSPGAWLARAPAKVASTLDYFGAAPWYLHAAIPPRSTTPRSCASASSRPSRAVCCCSGRCCRARGRRASARARLGVALAGAIAALSVHGSIGYLALALVVVLLGPRAWARVPLVVPAGAVVVLLTALVHAVFFGAGRYGRRCRAVRGGDGARQRRHRARPIPPLLRASANSLRRAAARPRCLQRSAAAPAPRRSPGARGPCTGRSARPRRRRARASRWRSTHRLGRPPSRARSSRGAHRRARVGDGLLDGGVRRAGLLQRGRAERAVVEAGTQALLICVGEDARARLGEQAEGSHGDLLASSLAASDSARSSRRWRVLVSLPSRLASSPKVRARSSPRHTAT